VKWSLLSTSDAWTPYSNGPLQATLRVSWEGVLLTGREGAGGCELRSRRPRPKDDLDVGFRTFPCVFCRVCLIESICARVRECVRACSCACAPVRGEAEQACVAVSGVIQYCIRFGLLKYSCPLPQAAASWEPQRRASFSSPRSTPLPNDPPTHMLPVGRQNHVAKQFLYPSRRVVCGYPSGPNPRGQPQLPPRRRVPPLQGASFDERMTPYKRWPLGLVCVSLHLSAEWSSLRRRFASLSASLQKLPFEPLRILCFSHCNSPGVKLKAAARGIGWALPC
jgi:hypothetical protein